MSTKKILLGVFSLVVLSIFIPIFSVKAATYPINDVPCALSQQQGYVTALCDGHITINNDSPLNPGQALNVQWYSDLSGYNGIVGAPSMVKFNGQEGAYNNSCDNNCLKAWSLSLNAPNTNGCYSVSVRYQWTWDGSYEYTNTIPYQVGAVNCTGGNTGGGSPNPNYTIPVPGIEANPQSVISGNSSDITWWSTSSDSCVVVDSDGYTVGDGLSGTYNTGSLYEDTTYTITCYGRLALGPRQNKFVDIFNNIKEKIWSVIPTALADIWQPPNEPPAASASVTVTVSEPVFQVQLELDSAKQKDLIKKGVTDLIGRAHFKTTISNIPSGKTCQFYNGTNPLSASSCIGCSNYPFSTNGIYYNSLGNLSLDDNNIKVKCTDVNTTESSIYLVKAQSGTLSPTSANSCQIPLNQSTCSIPLTYTTVNPNPGTPTKIKNSAGATLWTDNDGNGTNVPVSFSYGANQPITSYNAVDGENNGPSIENTLATTTITTSCATGTVWNGTVCTPATTIDLTASNTTPNTAQVNVAKTFSAIISNQGTATTGKTFYNIFQTATGFNDDYTPMGLQTYGASPSPMAILGANTSNTATKSFTFTTPGIIYMRACADKNTSMQGGIDEGSSENNNCSPNWIPVTVSGGADLVAGTTWPTSAPAGVATTYSSTITNQGSVSTGASFYNLFQTATGFDDPTLQLGPINLVDYPTTQMAALTAGQSNTATKSITLSAGNYFMRACADKSSASNTGTISEPGAEGNNCSAWVPLSISPQDQPDLIAGAPTPTVAVLNVATTFRSLITNQGLAGTGKSFGNLFQVTTNPISGPITDYPTSLSMSALAGNGGSATAVSPAITFTSAGTYYMRACADKTSATSLGVVAESSETNNCSAPWTPIIVSSGGLPDLTAGGITPTSVMVNVATTLQATVANIGVASTGGSFYNLIQLSPNNPGESPIVEQRVSMTTLPAQSSKNFSVTYTFKTAGIYYGRVCADKSSGEDRNGTVIESNETNNCGEWTKIIVSGSDKPDLVAGTPTPAVVVINMPNTFSSVITNQGKVSTGDKVNNLFQVSTSSNGASGVTDYPADVNLPALDGGESGTTISPKITFEKEMTYYMRACADKTSAGSSGSITESNEDNNCSPWTPIIVSSGGLPDLTAGGITPTSVMIDVPTTFQATIANIGIASTNTSFYNLIQTSTSPTGSNPVDLQRISMTALSAQSSKILTFTYTPKAAGTFYARVCADKSTQTDTGTISESNETNNCGPWTAIAVTSNAKPDLIAGTPTPTVVVIDLPNTFSAKITNQGTVSTGTKVNNLFQVSTSATGSADVTDYPASESSPALDGGESGTTTSPSITFTKEIPHYMRVCADKTSAGSSGSITESNEDNNCSPWTEIKVQAEGLPVDGGWTDWSCGSCSVPCGGGTQSCSRTCTNPVPQNGGAQCVGPTTTEQTCNTQACGGGGTGELMLTLTASPSQIFKGRSSTLTWNSTADTCTSEDFVTGDKPTGSVLVTPMATTTYKIACKNSVAEDTASATVKVINPVIIEN